MSDGAWVLLALAGLVMFNLGQREPGDPLVSRKVDTYLGYGMVLVAIGFILMILGVPNPISDFMMCWFQNC